MFFTKTTVAAALVAAVDAHMVMTSPSPFNPTSLTNGPLQPDGSDFPCKMSGSYPLTGGEVNEYELGSKQQLAFKGSAVHGGGSCQVSVTYDSPPTKNSVWKVIHSIEGGCPARDTPGNLGDDANAKDPFTYDYTIPAELPSGKATIAWSWVNFVGNREFYMNCGALDLKGSGGSKDFYNSLPDMAIANIPGLGHPEGEYAKEYVYNNPGKSVENNIKSGAATQAIGSGSGSGSGSGTDSGSGSGPEPAPSSAAPAPSAAPSSGSGGVFLTVPAGGSDAAPTPTASAAPEAPTSSAAAPVVPSSSAAPAPPATPSSSPSTGGSTGACTEGNWKCVDGTSFQRCASGAWSTIMNMAAGTSCTPGESATLALAGKRVVRAFVA